ncbi:hypothetical protein PIB30_049104 [Stylosanthes scabra]|uniref:Uncharacterized protein n=1 Tax=Stylosanthes scabra TaxID=79078 RepID=A0ABU6SID8_9FABA|nr:hypothetical protein [Stylosanthes scabra]
MNKVDEESHVVVDFLDQYLCSKKPLCLNMLVKWEKEKESVIEYLEATTGGLKNFFKMKSERELSTSNVVKSEQGMVVNQPSGKARDFDLCYAQYLFVVGQVYAARLLCLGRYEELRAKREVEQKKEESVELEKNMEREKKLQLVIEQVAQKEKELLELKNDNVTLKGKVQSLEKDKLDLESRVVELCGQKKEVELSKENHGYDMLLVGFERAKRHAEFLFPEVNYDKLDPIKIVHNGVLVDDDEVDVEGGGDHDPEV